MLTISTSSVKSEVFFRILPRQLLQPYRADIWYFIVPMKCPILGPVTGGQQKTERRPGLAKKLVRARGNTFPPYTCQNPFKITKKPFLTGLFEKIFK